MKNLKTHLVLLFILYTNIILGASGVVTCTISGSNSACSNGAVTLNISGTNCPSGDCDYLVYTRVGNQPENFQSKQNNDNSTYTQSGINVTTKFYVKMVDHVNSDALVDVSDTCVFTVNPAPSAPSLKASNGSTNSFSVCIDTSASKNVTVNFTYSPVIAGATYQLYVDGTAKSATINTNGTIVYTSGGATGGSNHNFQLDVTNSGCTSGKSNTMNVSYYSTPKPTQVNDPGTIITVKTTQSPVDLASFLSNVPNFVKLTFTGGPGVKTNSSNAYVFDPSAVTPGFVYTVQYQAENTADAACTASGTLNTQFRVVDADASLPPFIQNEDPMPICEDAASFNLLASIDPACFTSGTAPTNVSGEMYNGNGWVTLTATKSSKDIYSGNYLYHFTIFPSSHNPAYPYIYVVFYTDNCYVYGGRIPLTLKQTPFLQGLPKTSSADTIRLCSSSKDSISMRGNPSGGFYNYYLGTPAGIGYNFTKIAGSISYSGFTPPTDDPSLQVFTAEQVFKDHASSNTSNIVKIVYNYPTNTKNACPDSITRILKFDTPVGVSFIKPSSICFGDTLSLSVDYGSVPKTAGDRFYWSLGDGFVVDFDTLTTIKHNYKAPGKYEIRFKTDLIAPPANMCNNDVRDSIRVGAKPVVDFEVSRNFLGDDTRFHSLARIIDSSLADNINDMDTIVTWNWSFGTPANDQHLSTIGGDTTFKYTILQTDPYVVVHTATAAHGCSSTITHYVPVFPIKIPTTNQFVLDSFKINEAEGWFHSGQYKLNSVPLSSWQDTIANENTIKPYPGGGAAWITRGNPDPAAGYYNNEKSWVESPVYNIANLPLPMVSLNTWADFDNLFDGAALQYAFCDSTPFGKEQWHTLGEANKGLNWYNFNLLNGQPGGELQGWTNDTLKHWLLSAYPLTEILDSINKSPNHDKMIRFRVVLGTNGDNKRGSIFDGFAFDNFFIGQRNRKVLVENFCDNDPLHVKKGLETIYKDPQGIYVEYHVSSFTNNDPINKQNPADPSARALLYGIGKALPRGVIDGIGFNKDKDLSQWGVDSFFRRSLITSPFKIGIHTQVSSGGQLEISDTITKVSLSAIPGPFVVQVAVLEKHVVVGTDTFFNVLRNMLPDAAGHRLAKNYDWSTNFVSTNSWSPFVKPQGPLMVVVFIQDENTNEIYQSDYILVDSITAISLTVPPHKQGTYSYMPPAFTEVALSPNPASEDIRLTFNGILAGNYAWAIVDGLGNVLETGSFGQNINAAILPVSGIQSGMYYLRIDGEGQSFTKKFSVIR